MANAQLFIQNHLAIQKYFRQNFRNNLSSLYEHMLYTYTDDVHTRT